MPKVSVIMSVRNGEAYLKACIDSILGQTFGDFEFIIIDDASTDASAVLIDEYTLADDRVRLVGNKENLGLTKSLNIALKKARGEYIARMDADDISFPERFDKQVKFLDENPDYGVVGAFAQVIDDKGDKVVGFENWIEETDNKTIQKELIKWNVIVHPLAMVRRSVIEKVGGYDESFKYAQDYDLWLRIAMISKIHNLPEFLLNYRMSKESITASRNKLQAKCAFRARLNAIKRGQYSLFSGIYLLWPLVRSVLPKKVTDFYK